MFKLISATPSPFARKVRVALLEKSIPFELITVNPWNSAEKVQIHNPLGKIPILIIDDKKPIYESSYILEWLEAKFPKPSLLPVGIEELWRQNTYRLFAMEFAKLLFCFSLNGCERKTKEVHLGRSSIS